MRQLIERGENLFSFLSGKIKACAFWVAKIRFIADLPVLDCAIESECAIDGPMQLAQAAAAAAATKKEGTSFRRALGEREEIFNRSEAQPSLC